MFGQVDQAKFLKCIADPTRMQILGLLAKSQEKYVGEIAGILGKEQSLISHHLATLKKCNIVLTRQENQKIYYAIADPRISQLVIDIQSLVTHIPLCKSLKLSRKK
jgi:DNA-binding transcriptional ArsR family regulator